jgi:hypothetical protein
MKANSKIVDNTGGGVGVSGSGNFVMEGGVISGNTALWGGGVHIHNNTVATFIKKGGTIYGDTNNSHAAGSTENTASLVIGHAVHASGGNIRNLDAGPDVKLYARYDGASWTYDGTSEGVGNTTANWY